MNISMVNTNTIAEISNKQTEYVSVNGSYLEFGIDCYEAGMIQVLKGIAEDFLYTADVSSSDFTRKLNDIVTEKRIELEATFNTRDFNLIKEYEDAINNADSGDAADHYLQGFIDGYRYLAHRIAYNSEGFNVKRFKKQYSEENK